MSQPTTLPRQMTLFVAFPCNLRCKNCWLFGVADVERDYMGTPDRDLMSFEVFQRAVDPLFDGTATPTFSFMGGEPTLHPRLADMVRHLKQRGPAYVDINTNGTRLHKVGRALTEAGMDAFYISIDGSNAHINDAGRGEGSFDEAMAGLRTCLELRRSHGVKVAINYTITAENYTDVIAVARLAASLELDEVFLNLSVFVTEAEGLAGREALARELGMPFESWRGFQIDPVIAGVDADALMAQLDELGRTKWPMKVFVQPVGYSPLELRSYFTTAWPAQIKEKACPVQTFRTAVLPNGDVSPCTLYHDVVLGNLKTATLEEIWYGEAYRRFREVVTARLLPTCVRCCDLFDETKGDPMAFVNDSRLKHRVG